MKRLIVLIIVVCIVKIINAQTENPKIYNSQANAFQDIYKALIESQQQKKHVFIMIGFNECPWCRMFHNYIQEDIQIDSVFKANYIKVAVNFSRENKNMELMKFLEYPNRFGFPVFVILDDKGRRLHTQNSAYLEEGKGYNKEKIIGFLNNWSPRALEDKSYN